MFAEVPAPNVGCGEKVTLNTIEVAVVKKCSRVPTNIRVLGEAFSCKSDVVTMTMHFNNRQMSAAEDATIFSVLGLIQSINMLTPTTNVYELAKESRRNVGKTNAYNFDPGKDQDINCSTGIPKVYQLLDTIFNRQELRCDKAVVQAAVLKGKRDERVQDLLQLDVSPLPFCLVTAGQVEDCLIIINYPIPIKKQQIFLISSGVKLGVLIQFFEEYHEDILYLEHFSEDPSTKIIYFAFVDHIRWEKEAQVIIKKVLVPSIIWDQIIKVDRSKEEKWCLKSVSMIAYKSPEFSSVDLSKCYRVILIIEARMLKWQ
ncbi:hypothetical protein POM88_040263 [Heracleum sosnowskyi]|uniref:Uncharacterized protein n=1 Tax=Heracleum sosnowskyi TaxID=360622 RepID=A0AAD8HBN6_9APIA|nr:hypothetical protein POM88_040263 [Heracleum sosnowskyi]